jgi:AraC-like DNA-binding protein
MKIKLYRPESPLLKPFIECFYTLKRDRDESPVKYVGFPSIFPMVCLNANAEIELANDNLVFSHSRTNTLENTLICDFDYSGWIKYEGATDEMVIYFKPLGLNAFLDRSLRSYVTSFFMRFDPYEDYKARMIEIFSVNNDEKRIELLEDYWSSKLRGFDHPFLQNVVDEIMSNDFRGAISELAARHGISRTTLVKHFDLHICTTPSQFKKIVRFRNAMKRHRNKISHQNLSEISHEVDYFDQSHMIKDFKSLTKLPPKSFFSKLSTLEDGQINWLFL